MIKMVVPVPDDAGENKLVGIAVHVRAHRSNGAIEKIELLGPREFFPGSNEFDLLSKSFSPVVEDDGA